MLDFQIVRIRKVFNMEKLLHLMHALSGQIYNLVLLIYNKISVLFHFHAHDSVHLRIFSGTLAPRHLARQNITRLI